jgi:hypothetical protein
VDGEDRFFKVLRHIVAVFIDEAHNFAPTFRGRSEQAGICGFREGPHRLEQAVRSVLMVTQA